MPALNCWDLSTTRAPHFPSTPVQSLEVQRHYHGKSHTFCSIWGKSYGTYLPKTHKNLKWLLYYFTSLNFFPLRIYNWYEVILFILELKFREKYKYWYKLHKSVHWLLCCFIPIEEQCHYIACFLPSTIILNNAFSYSLQLQVFPYFSFFSVIYPQHNSFAPLCKSFANSKNILSSSSSTKHLTLMLLQFSISYVCLFSHLLEFWISQPDTLAQLFLPYFMHPAEYVYRLTVKCLLPQQLIIF